MFLFGRDQGLVIGDKESGREGSSVFLPHPVLPLVPKRKPQADDIMSLMPSVTC